MTAINLSECAKKITLDISIKGLRRFQWRLWLAAHLFNLGSWVAGTKCEIDVVTR